MVLANFKITKDFNNEFTVLSKISGNEAVVKPTKSSNPKDTLLWTVLNDLYHEGHFDLHKTDDIEI